MKLIVGILLLLVLLLAVATTLLMLQMLQTRGCGLQFQQESSTRSSTRFSTWAGATNPEDAASADVTAGGASGASGERTNEQMIERTNKHKVRRVRRGMDEWMNG